MEKETYLTFLLGKELFAVSVNYVLEVLEQQTITTVPKAPEHILGIINFRGQILPVINTHFKFGLPQVMTEKTYVIVFEIPNKDIHFTIAATADAVKDVIEIIKDDIQPVPEMGISYDAKFIEGAIRHEECFILLLNIEKILTSTEIEKSKLVVDTPKN
jgi:purine-binding chemotaxis protein CheW